MPLPGPGHARVPGCLPAGRPGAVVRLRPASSAPVVPDQPGRPGPAGSEPGRMPGAAGIRCPQQLVEAWDPRRANHDPARRRAHVGQGGEAHLAGETGDRDLGPGLPAVGRAAEVAEAWRDDGDGDHRGAGTAARRTRHVACDRGLPGQVLGPAAVHREQHLLGRVIRAVRGRLQGRAGAGRTGAGSGRLPGLRQVAAGHGAGPGPRIAAGRAAEQLIIRAWRSTAYWVPAQAG